MTPIACPTPRGHRLTPQGYKAISCRRLACPYCGPRITLSTVKAIELAHPHTSGVLSLPTDVARRRGTRLTLRSFAAALSQIARCVRAEGSTFEYCWTVELSQQGSPHVHFLQHGSRIGSDRFRDLAHVASAYGDVQPIRHLPRMARYVLKLPMAGLDLDLDRPEDVMALHLILNGEALVHATRRFWRDEIGDPLQGLRAARAAARRVSSGGVRPTQAQLQEWRRHWKLPGVRDDFGFSSVGLFGRETDLDEGSGGGQRVPRPVATLGPRSEAARLGQDHRGR